MNHNRILGRHVFEINEDIGHTNWSPKTPWQCHTTFITQKSSLGSPPRHQIARHCRDLGMTVLALDDLSGGFAANVPQGVTFIEGAASDFAKCFVEHSRKYQVKVIASWETKACNLK